MEQSAVDQLFNDVKNFAENRGGKIYSAIDHPQFEEIPYHHGPERFSPIADNMPEGMRTALDIGSHWGYFSHKLESLGLDVTATEISLSYLEFLLRLKTLYGDSFEIWPKSIFEMKGPLEYDVVLALNILHHFIKTDKEHARIIDFLSRLKTKAIFFQAHSVNEGQMQNAFQNYSPTEFCEFIATHVPGMSSYKMIGSFGSRPMYLIQ